jgi:hypothetical protein
MAIEPHHMAELLNMEAAKCEGNRFPWYQEASD